MMDKLTSTTRLMVVETIEDERWLGALDVKGSTVTIMTGLRGRPKVLNLAEIVDVTAADKHPDVEMDAEGLTCDACSAEPGESCYPGCIGLAAKLDESVAA